MALVCAVAAYLVSNSSNSHAIAPKALPANSHLCTPCRSLGYFDGTDDFTWVAQLVSQAQNLVSLRLHLFKQSHRILGRQYLRQALAKQRNLPKLRLCSLRGLGVNIEDLLQFLHQTTPRVLMLHEVQAHAGTWRPVLDNIASANPTIASNGFYLCHLFETMHAKHVVFDGVGARQHVLRGP